MASYRTTRKTRPRVKPRRQVIGQRQFGPPTRDRLRDPQPSGRPPAPGAAAPEQINHTAGTADLFNASLERIRNSAVGGYAQSQAAYDAGLSDLKRKFFDPTNQYSEASLLTLAEKQGRQHNVNAMAARGQLFNGAFINAEDAITFDIGHKRQDMQERFDTASAGLLSQKTAADAQIRQRIEDAEFNAALLAAQNSELTTPGEPDWQALMRSDPGFAQAVFRALAGPQKVATVKKKKVNAPKKDKLRDRRR